MEIIPKVFEIICILSPYHNIEILCNIAGVSFSGYYKYKRIAHLQLTKQDREKQDLSLIKNLVLQYKKKYGYRMISMKLKQVWIIMNHKKVHRLMKKYDLLATIRRKDPYLNIRKATQEHNTARNILNREFGWLKAFKKIGTDISYLRFQSRWIYLSIMKDMVTGEVLSKQISESLELWFVYDTLKDLEQIKDKLQWALVHSDQGFHYTHPSFKLWVEELWCIQSMSRRWNCIDNSPTESFFGHMKDEIDISECANLDEVKSYMNNYIYEYNNERPQWNRKKMTPVQYRNHLLNN